MLKLIIEDDEGRKTVVPFVREEITIGRQEGNTIRLTERNVSRRHARLLRSNGAVTVEDLGSFNGIRVNGERIFGQIVIRDGDLVQIGDYDLALQETQPALASSEATAIIPLNPRNGTTVPTRPALAPQASSDEVDPPAQTDEIEEARPEDVQSLPGTEPELSRQATSIIRVSPVDAPRQPPRSLDADQAPRLVVLNTEFAGREFACVLTELSIGRTPDNDVALDHRSLSRNHAKLVREDDGVWRVFDLESANGVAINGETYAQATLRSHDVITLGHVRLKFIAPGDAFTFAPPREQGAKKRSPALGIAAIGLALVVTAGVGTWLLRSRAHQRAEAPIVIRPEEQPAAPEDLPVDDGVELKLARARTLIEERSWDEATQLLGELKVGDGSLHPEAKTLLTAVRSETPLLESLRRAEAAIGAGRLEEANTLLDEISHTKLLVRSLKAARESWRIASDKRLVRSAGRRPVPQSATPDPLDEAPRLYIEGLNLFKNQRFREATVALERCVELMPDHALCHKALGGTYAKLAKDAYEKDDPKTGRAESAKGAEHYRRFLELAPRDKDAARVMRIIREYENSR